jgi:hypothetical protein
MPRDFLFATTFLILAISVSVLGISSVDAKVVETTIDTPPPVSLKDGGAWHVRKRHHKAYRYRAFSRDKPPVIWYVGPRYPFHHRDGCASRRRECAENWSYRTDDYYACVRGC